MPNTANRCIGTLLLAGLGLFGLPGGCASQSVGTPTRGIVLDGDIGEWSEGAAATCDDRFLYLRFTVDGEQYSLQSGPRTVSVYIDSDADAATGQPHSDGPLAGMGVDIEVQLSPRRDDGSPGRGAKLWTVDRDGVRTSYKAAAFDFAVSPTYASSWYEMRVSRSPEGAAIPVGGLGSTGAAIGIIALLGPDGTIEASADPFRVEVATQPAPGPRVVEVGPPLKPDDAVRVVSWNIERSGPMVNPEPFKRILGVLRPDVLLLQEWEQGDASAVQAWLEGAGMAGWSVRKNPGDLTNGGGVLVASRFPIEPFGAGGLTTGEGAEKAVRFVAGVVRSPLGDLLAGSTHLKCCGSNDSPEDRQRMSEAKAINALVRASQGARNISLRVISGDLNLVGSRPPLDLLRAGLDADGSDLDIADAMVLGEDAYLTWRDPKTDFPPGRLDYFMFSDSTAEPLNAFVLDTARLSDGALAGMGLLRDDSSASDHLPVVVDLRPLR